MTYASLRFARPFMAIAVVAFIAAGCSDDDDDDAVFVDPNQGNIQVFATDAPPELDRLNSVQVSVQRIDAIGGVATSTVATLYDSDVSGIQTFDLVPLRAGNQALIASGTASIGSYDAVRIFFSDIEVQYQTPAGVRTYSTNNGTLVWGGEQQGGVDVAVFSLIDPVDLTSGENEQLLVDFDLAESLDVTGPTSDPTSMTFTPIGRARDLTPETGRLAGVVRFDNGTDATTDDTPVNNANVVLRSNAEVVATTKTDSSGTYVIEGLDAGSYLLVVTDPANTQRTIESNVEVNTSQTTTNDVLLTTPAN